MHERTVGHPAFERKISGALANICQICWLGLEFRSSPGCAGESDYEKPRILEIAEVMQNIDSLDEGKKKQERAIKKGKEAELHARKLEVSLNETR